MMRRDEEPCALPESSQLSIVSSTGDCTCETIGLTRTIRRRDDAALPIEI